MRKVFLIMIFAIMSQSLFAQMIEVNGKVKDAATGKAVVNTHIWSVQQQQGTATDKEGTFILRLEKNTENLIRLSHIGYRKLEKTVEVSSSKETLQFSLIPEVYTGETVVVTATRSKRNALDIPAQIEVIDRRELKRIPAQKLDDILQYTAGLNVSRSSGIFTIRPVVTLRGLSGDEQGRTLVLVDGVPINKGDTGGANWNRINKNNIERIEIYRGPGSSLYGNNAMGGVINIITRKPEEKLEGNGSFSYGTYDTKSAGLYLGSKYSNKGYLKVSGFLTNSDGYNPLPDSLRENPDYSIKRFLKEYNFSVQSGYDFNKLLKTELQYSFFKDKRGEGEKIIAPDGEYRHFDTHFLRGRVYGSTSKFNYNVLLYYQHEDYFRLDERMRGEDYSRFDVRSDRVDMGSMLFMNYGLSDHHTLTMGAEFKLSSVDGGDYYATSPDSILNRGRMNNIGIYLQDDWSLVRDRLNLIAGIRYDHVRFYDGDFQTTEGAWIPFLPELKDHTWTAFSPRLAVNYKFFEKSKIYISFSKGFRASILDDLCRSGWMWVGPKIANPELGPEKIFNYEIGADIKSGEKLRLAPAIFFSKGKDFLYYTQTLDSLWGKRAVYQRQNVTGVNIYGAELEVSYAVLPQLNFFANYTYNKSTIEKFEENPALEGTTLKFTPENQAKAGMFWQNKIVNLNLAFIYKSKQYIDDENKQEMDPYGILNVNLSREIIDELSISIDVQNVFDNRHMENYLYMSPGRIITADVNYTF